VDLYDEDAGPHLASATKSVNVLAAAPNLRVAQTRTPAALAPGRIPPFSLTISNLGNSDATGVFVTFQLPTAFRAAAGNTAGWQALGGRKYRLDLGTVAAAGSVTVVFKAQALATAKPGTVVTTTAQVG